MNIMSRQAIKPHDRGMQIITKTLELTFVLHQFSNVFTIHGLLLRIADDAQKAPIPKIWPKVKKNDLIIFSS